MQTESEVEAAATLEANQVVAAAEAAEAVAPVRRKPPSSHRVYPQSTASAHCMHALLSTTARRTRSPSPPYAFIRLAAHAHER